MSQTSSTLSHFGRRHHCSVCTMYTHMWSPCKGGEANFEICRCQLANLPPQVAFLTLLKSTHLFNKQQLPLPGQPGHQMLNKHTRAALSDSDCCAELNKQTNSDAFLHKQLPNVYFRFVYYESTRGELGRTEKIAQCKLLSKDKLQKKQLDFGSLMREEAAAAKNGTIFYLLKSWWIGGRTANGSK